MKILFDETAIRKRIAEMGREISAYYGGDLVTLVVLANGALIFGADLARAITCPLEWDVVSVASYADDRSSGKLTFRSTPKLDPAGRRILLADEVLDTGITLARLKEWYAERGAAEIKTAVMVEKDRLRAPGAPEHADWTGAELPDLYMVGYGLDSHEKYRNLPYVAELE
jgi:hypoxanthine phosphoribosyltransferase